MIKYIVVTFYNDKQHVIGKYKGMKEITDKQIKSMMKEHKANYATIEHRVKLKHELNIDIA